MTTRDEVLAALGGLSESANALKVAALQLATKLALDPSDPQTEGEIISAAELLNLTQKALNRAIGSVERQSR